MGAALSVDLAAGSYTLYVSGTGAGDPVTTGYSRYGSLGRYRLTSGAPTLTVQVVGQGTVTSPGGELVCSSRCTAPVELDASLELEAQPADGWRFSRWAGTTCGTLTSCGVLVGGARVVGAVFAPAVPLTVTMDGGGGGVVSTPTGISCPPQCTASFALGTSVSLRPMEPSPPARTGAFDGWSGACSGSAVPCEVRVVTPTTVTARFVRANIIGLAVVGGDLGEVAA